MIKVVGTDDQDLVVEKLMALSTEEFQDFGAEGLGYIKVLGEMDESDQPLFALHSANGSHIATGDDMNALLSIASQNHMVPMSVQ